MAKWMDGGVPGWKCDLWQLAVASGLKRDVRVALAAHLRQIPGPGASTQGPKNETRIPTLPPQEQGWKELCLKGAE